MSELSWFYGCDAVFNSAVPEGQKKYTILMSFPVDKFGLASDDAKMLYLPLIGDLDLKLKKKRGLYTRHVESIDVITG